VFVEFDDLYDTCEYGTYAVEDLDRWVNEEADAYLSGLPSLGRSQVYGEPNSATAVIYGPRRWRRRFTVRVSPGGREFWARNWDDIWGSLPEMGVSWRNVRFESDAVRDAVTKRWGDHPDAPT